MTYADIYGSTAVVRHLKIKCWNPYRWRYFSNAWYLLSFQQEFPWRQTSYGHMIWQSRWRRWRTSMQTLTKIWWWYSWKKESPVASPQIVNCILYSARYRRVLLPRNLYVVMGSAIRSSITSTVPIPNPKTVFTRKRKIRWATDTSNLKL